MSDNNFYITTPIYYVNDKPHIGHAYTSIICDIIARFKRLDGFDSYFLTGTDEHGQKIQKSAEELNISPEEFTDNISQKFVDLAEFLQLSNNDFIRTTQKRHHKAVKDLWQRLFDRGYIYTKDYEGWYAVKDEAYFAEDEVSKNENGQMIANETGAEVEWMKEPSYFFRLSEFTQPLLTYIEENPEFIFPNSRRNEVIKFIEQGLEDLCISRSSISWGINVPDDKEHVIYVWLDALTNYLTAVGYPDMESELYQKFWPADIHVVGKDILRFHAIYWPAFLMAAELPLPKQIVAHGWWTNEGKKISKRYGNVIDPIELVNTYGLDQCRYFMLREIPFGQDGDFSKSAMINRMNNDLANDLGNLGQRVLSMIYKNMDATIYDISNITDEDEALLNKAYDLFGIVKQRFENRSFHIAMQEVWYVVQAANQYVDAQAPWKLKKEDEKRMKVVLSVLAEVIRILFVLLQPVLPIGCEKMLNIINVSDRSFTTLNSKHALKKGHKIEKPLPIFAKYVEEVKE